ncbi:UDP-3-O-[3-hydroxymyristoyl] glucosamineN-acyl transferase [Mycobacteroides abscessus]|nr:UDP-3-O-[3-hydroxymyristoyl] glucosamineN-acyl transferase [Mycobacteroides abscessus]
MRSPPQPGQSRPVSALSGHTGSTPPGVVGSPNQTAAQPAATAPATAAGAARRETTVDGREVVIAFQYPPFRV